MEGLSEVAKLLELAVSRLPIPLSGAINKREKKYVKIIKAPLRKGFTAFALITNEPHVSKNKTIQAKIISKIIPVNDQVLDCPVVAANPLFLCKILRQKRMSKLSKLQQTA